MAGTSPAMTQNTQEKKPERRIQCPFWAFFMAASCSALALP